MMPTGRPLKLLNLTNEERATLQAWTRRRKTVQQLALRSRIVLRCDQGQTNQQIAEHLHVNPATVVRRPAALPLALHTYQFVVVEPGRTLLR